MKITGKITKDEGMHIAYINEWPVAGVGDTPSAALRSLFDCFDAYLKENEKMGNEVPELAIPLEFSVHKPQE